MWAYKLILIIIERKILQDWLGNKLKAVCVVPIGQSQQTVGFGRLRAGHSSLWKEFPSDFFTKRLRHRKNLFKKNKNNLAFLFSFFPLLSDAGCQ